LPPVTQGLLGLSVDHLFFSQWPAVARIAYQTHRETNNSGVSEVFTNFCLSFCAYVFSQKNIQQALLILGYMKFFSMKIAETLYLFIMNFHEITLPDSVISCNLR